MVYIYNHLIAFCNIIDLLAFKVMNDLVKSNLSSSPSHTITSHPWKWTGSEFRHNGRRYCTSSHDIELIYRISFCH